MPIDDRHWYAHGPAQPAAHVADAQPLAQAPARIDVEEGVQAVLLVDRELVTTLLLVGWCGGTVVAVGVVVAVG